MTELTAIVPLSARARWEEAISRRLSGDYQILAYADQRFDRRVGRPRWSPEATRAAFLGCGQLALERALGRHLLIGGRSVPRDRRDWFQLPTAEFRLLGGFDRDLRSVSAIDLDFRR